MSTLVSISKLLCVSKAAVSSLIGLFEARQTSNGLLSMSKSDVRGARLPEDSFPALREAWRIGLTDPISTTKVFVVTCVLKQSA